MNQAILILPPLLATAADTSSTRQRFWGAGAPAIWPLQRAKNATHRWVGVSTTAFLQPGPDQPSPEDSVPQTFSPQIPRSHSYPLDNIRLPVPAHCPSNELPIHEATKTGFPLTSLPPPPTSLGSHSPINGMLQAGKTKPAPPKGSKKTKKPPKVPTDLCPTKTHQLHPRGGTWKRL